MTSSPTSPAGAASAGSSKPGTSPQVPCEHAIGFSHPKVSDRAGNGAPLTADDPLRPQNLVPVASSPDLVGTVAHAVFVAADEEAR